MAAPAGNWVGLNLGPRYIGPGTHVPLNLGVEWNTDPPDPPDPVFRGTRMSTDIAWARPERHQRSVSAAWHQVPQVYRGSGLGWSPAGITRAALSLLWGTPDRYAVSASLVWEGRQPAVRNHTDIGWQSLPQARLASAMAWTSQGLVRHGRALPWTSPDLQRNSATVAWLAQLAGVRGSRALAYRHPALFRRGTDIPWGLGKPIPWIVRPPVPPEPPDPESPFPPGNRLPLNLSCPIVEARGFVPLNLGVIACYGVRPARRTYIVNNSISVVRLPDRTPIEVDSVSVAGASGSWGHSVDLSLSRHGDRALLAPTSAGPAQIEITINGYVWTAIVESFDRRRQIDTEGRPNFSVSVTGTSRTKLLAAPYAPARTKVLAEARSAAQLVDEELTDTGYTATYDAVDWLVPAGAWYYDGTTPMDAIVRLAEASGAIVQSDPADLSMAIVPQYPVSPWDWTVSAADHVVLDDLILADSMAVQSAPLYDAVVVTGEIQGKGVITVVKRAGEAGTTFAPQVSSPLINTTAVSTERGRNILADRGEQAAIDLTLPLFPEPVLPGQIGRVLPQRLVEVREADGTWHGQSTAYRIEARRDGDALVVEQTVTLERHLSDAD
jgi:hypothetical protein